MVERVRITEQMLQQLCDEINKEARVFYTKTFVISKFNSLWQLGERNTTGKNTMSVTPVYSAPSKESLWRFMKGVKHGIGVV